jgi:hypothetical protein
MKRSLLAMTVAIPAMLAGGSAALLTTTSTALAQLAQLTQRSVCCTQMKGRWETNPNTGQMQCNGVDTNRYNICVMQNATGRQ